MKDLDDKTTNDLFPVVKKRGRPSTGLAKSSAERQAAYRLKKTASCSEPYHNLNIWIDLGAKLALDRMCKHEGLSVSKLLERLILDCDCHTSMSLTGDDLRSYWEIL